MQDPRTNSHNILILDGHPTLELLAEALSSRGCHVSVVHSSSEARQYLETSEPQVVVMSLVVNDDDGLLVLSMIRSLTPAPIIVYGQSNRRADPVLALKLGADQFIAFPAGVEFLEAGVEAALRRSDAAIAVQEIDAGKLSGAIHLNQEASTVEISGTAIDLTPTELRLLEVLVSRPGLPVSRVQLSEQVWGEPDSIVGRAIDTHIRRLRAKLQGAPQPRPSIHSVRGCGYRLVA